METFTTSDIQDSQGTDTSGAKQTRQLYLLEVFIDKVTVFVNPDEEANPNANLFVKLKFIPKADFTYKENQLVHLPRRQDEVTVIEDDEKGRQKWSRTFRIGKSYLFPSDPVLMRRLLAKYPLQFQLWTDEPGDKPDELIGEGSMAWDRGFYFLIDDNPFGNVAKRCEMFEPMSLKQRTIINLECCCSQAGQIDFIVRLSALGECVCATYQQLTEIDPNSFIMLADHVPSKYECRWVAPDNKHANMFRTLYDLAVLEDPMTLAKMNRVIQVCMELQSCGATRQTASCRQIARQSRTNSYTIQAIRLGDITGPCGNANCELAHKVKMYIRNLHTYKKKTQGLNLDTKPVKERPGLVCGACVCKDDRWHLDKAPKNPGKVLCKGCGGLTLANETCHDRLKALHGTGVTPIGSKTNFEYPTYYMTSITYDNPNVVKAMFPQNFMVFPCHVHCTSNPTPQCPCGKAQTVAPSCNPIINNAELKESSRINFCTEIPDEKDKDCKCNPPLMAPPCKTFDCACLIKAQEEDSRKIHKPWCPCYKHRPKCPVTRMNDEESNPEISAEKDEDEPDALPYGLPPVQLGPCPVIGRPCTVPDGFARMYKAGVQPTQPASWSEAGKVCCSKEFERIKKALKEYMEDYKKSDFRCLNRFYVDTEKRCCDKEQRLLNLMGKSCCGAHKLAVQDVYEKKKERDAIAQKNAEHVNK